VKKIKFKDNLGWKLFWCFTSSILLFFSFPPFGYWYLAFFSFVPLFSICEENRWINSLYGLLSGFTFYSFSLYWLKNVTGAIYLLLSLYLSIYWAFFLYLIFAFDFKKNIFLGSCLWFFLEILLSNILTGFPWLLIGLSQFNNPYILKFAKFSGIYGISFILMGINIFLYTLLKNKLSIQNLFFIFIILIFFAISKIPERKIYKGKINILLVQPNFIPQNISKDANKKIITRLLKEIEYKNVDLIFFPEGTFQSNLFENNDLIKIFKKFSIKKNCGILIGTFTKINESFYNSTVFINGENISVYNKIKLVPYGEFILGKRFKFIKNTFLKIAGYEPNLKNGNEFKVFKYKNVKFSSLICYENIFSEILEGFLKDNTEFFIVVTNDSWFGKSIGPYQHFYHNIFRSLESGRYFLQAGLTGITGIITPEGKVEKILEKNGENLFIEGILFYPLNIYISKTLYSEYGIYPLFLFCLIITGILLCKNWKK
jgi:apolipoprotein N-acyltransferase